MRPSHVNRRIIQCGPAKSALRSSQLFYDGYSQIALDLINQVKSSKACPPSDRLLHLTCLAKKYEDKPDEDGEEANESYTKQVGGIDLDFETEAAPGTPEPGLYETVYVTSHKAPCRAGAFSKDGQLVATGSADASIKVIVRLFVWRFSSILR